MKVTRLLLVFTKPRFPLTLLLLAAIVTFSLAPMAQVGLEQERANPPSVPLNGSRMGILGYDKGDVADWWKVEVEDGGRLIVILKGIDWDADLNLEIYDSEGSALLTQSVMPGSRMEKGFVRVPTGGGAYLIRVSAEPAVSEEICYNGTDDDSDGLKDCNDPDCDSSPACISHGYILKALFLPSISILLYSDERTEQTATLPGLALQELGYGSYTKTDDPVEFYNYLQGQSWDLVIVDHNTDPKMGTYWDEIEGYIKDNGLCIVSTYDVDDSESWETGLWRTMEATYLSDLSAPKPIYNSYTTSLFNFLEVVPDFEQMATPMSRQYVYETTGDLDLGDIIQATNGGQAAASFRLGLDAIVIGNNGRTILNSVPLSGNTSDLDQDGLSDAVELWMNEIAYVVTKHFAERTYIYPSSLPTRLKGVMDGINDAADFIGQGKFDRAASKLEYQLESMINLLAPAHPLQFWRNIKNPPIDYPQSMNERDAARDELMTFQKLAANFVEPFELITEFFNSQGRRKLFETSREPLEQMEVLEVWIEDSLLALSHAEETDVAVLMYPPTPVLSRIYEAYDGIEVFSLALASVINYSDEDKTVKLSVKISGYTDQLSKEVNVPARTSELVELNPPFLPDKPDLSSQSRFATLTIENDGYAHKSYPMELLAENEAAIHPAFYALLIAWVTSDDPMVQDVVEKAEEWSLLPLDGYWDVNEEHTEQQVAEHTEQQICALYDYLQKRESSGVVHRGLRYADNPPADTEWTQKVRSPGEAIARLEANCLDEAILHATLIKAIGMNPILILIPGEQHALVGWETWDGSGEYDCLQTTLIRYPWLATCSRALAKGREVCDGISEEQKIHITDIGISAEDYLSVSFYRDFVGILEVRSLEDAWEEIIKP